MKRAIPTHRRKMISSSFPDRLAALSTWNLVPFISTFLASARAFFGRSTTLAHNCSVTTFSTKKFSVLGLVVTLSTGYPTLITNTRHTLARCIYDLVVMSHTISLSKIWLGTKFAVSLWSMNKRMLFVVCTQMQILNSIIISNFVYVVNLLFPGKKATNVGLHNKSVFRDISTFVAIWMRWTFYHKVSICISILFPNLKIWSSFRHSKYL